MKSHTTTSINNESKGNAIQGRSDTAVKICLAWGHWLCTESMVLPAV